jgi:hypothetical protein
VASWGVMCACYGAPWWVAMAVFGRSVLAFGGMGVGVGEGRFGGFKQGGPQVVLRVEERNSTSAKDAERTSIMGYGELGLLVFGGKQLSIRDFKISLSTLNSG